MAVLRWAMLCERAIVEAETSNLSIICVLDEIRLDRAPPPELAKEERPRFILHSFTVVQLWSRSDEDKPEKFPVRSQLASPDGKVFGGAEQVVDLTNRQHSRVITRAPGFPWRGPGRYVVTIQSKAGKKWRTVERLHFKVAVLKPAAPTS